MMYHTDLFPLVQVIQDEDLVGNWINILLACCVTDPGPLTWVICYFV